jgi:hypothetical protein
MELRMHSAQTTKDIDLTLHDGTRLSKDPKERGEPVRAMLQEAAATRFDDYFEFLVGEAREDLDGAPEGGSRPPAEWEPVFDALAKECDLTMELREGFELVRKFTKILET